MGIVYTPRFKPGDLHNNYEVLEVLGRSPCSTDCVMRWKYKVKCRNCGAINTKWQFEILRKTKYCAKCVVFTKPKIKTIDPFEEVKKGNIPDFITMGARK